MKHNFQDTSLGVRQTEAPHSCPSVDQIVADPVNARLLRALEGLSRTLRFYDVVVGVSTPESIRVLPNWATEKRVELAEYYEHLDICFQPMAGDPEPRDITPVKEISFAKKALDRLGLTVSDQFWSTVDVNQVIEIYRSDMIQVYRNLNFFRVCGYSLLEISVIEWFRLWQRPSSTLDKMSEFIALAMTTDVPAMTYAVPEHILLEKRVETGLTDFFTPRAHVVNFQYIGSVYSARDSRPCGLICSATGSLVAEGEEALNIRFV